MILGLSLNLLLLVLVMILAVIHVKRERIENPQYTVTNWIWHFVGLLMLGFIACVVVTAILMPLGVAGPIIALIRITTCFIIGWNYPRYPYKKKGA